MRYIVAYADQTTYSNFIVEGPEQKDWQEYCKSLVQEAAELSYKYCAEEKNLYLDENIYFGAIIWCGWDSIVGCLVKLLVDRKYTIVNKNEACFTLIGTNIISINNDNEYNLLDSETLKKMIKLNLEKMKKYTGN